MQLMSNCLDLFALPLVPSVIAVVVNIQLVSVGLKKQPAVIAKEGPHSQSVQD